MKFQYLILHLKKVTQSSQKYVSTQALTSIKKQNKLKTLKKKIELNQKLQATKQLSIQA